MRRALFEELKVHVPAKWDVRVRWRDGQLATTARIAATLTGLCPKPDQEIWRLIKPDQNVILEPTVGGKSGADARVSCREANA